VTRKHMRGKSETERGTNFFKLKRGAYPPAEWCIPKEVRGMELWALLRERSLLVKQKGGHGLCREAEICRKETQKGAKKGGEGEL